MEKSYILDLIKEYYKNFCVKSKFSNSWKDRLYFQQHSYQKWAVTTIIDCVEKSDKMPINEIEDFINKMDDFSCLSNNSYMFSVAYDIGVDILDFIIMQ